MWCVRATQLLVECQQGFTCTINLLSFLRNKWKTSQPHSRRLWGFLSRRVSKNHLTNLCYPLAFQVTWTASWADLPSPCRCNKEHHLLRPLLWAALSLLLSCLTPRSPAGVRYILGVCSLSEALTIYWTSILAKRSPKTILNLGREFDCALHKMACKLYVWTHACFGSWGVGMGVQQHKGSWSQSSEIPLVWEFFSP